MGSLVASKMRVRTVSSGCPRASTARHPVSRSATGFRYVIIPAASVVTTPSPMDSRVTRACSFSRNRLAQQFLGPAEALCGLAIHGDDAPPPVDDHHRVGTGVEQPSEPLPLKDVLAHCAILAAG